MKGIWRWLDVRERFFLVSVSALQVALGVFDLLAVGLIGVITSVASRKLVNKNPGDNASTILNILNLQSLETKKMIVVLALLSFSLLISKSILSYILTRKLIRFLATKNSELSEELLRAKCLSSSPRIYSEAPENVRFSVVDGSNAIMIGVLGGLSAILTDLATLTFLFVGMIFISPSTTFLMFGLFAFIVTILTRRNQRSAEFIGEEFANYQKDGHEIIFQSVLSFRELYVGGLLEQLLKKFRQNRQAYGKVVSLREMIPFQGKYIFEVVALVASFGILAFQLSVSETTRAISMFAIFFSATFRIAPSSMRIYQGISTIKINKSIATSSNVNFEELGSQLEKIRKYDAEYNEDNFSGEVIARAITFRHNGTDKLLFTIDRFEVRPYEFVGIEGKSGTGKSTLLDIIIGIRKPTQGEVYISGTKATEAMRNNPGKIAYVPQRPHIVKGDVRLNLTYGNILEDNINEEALVRKLELVGMFNNGINREILSRDSSTLSGGQMQRLALARSLLLNPKLLILDEPTSGLDTETQIAWNDLFRRISQTCSLIVVSHRSEILKGADKIYVFEDGELRRK